MMTLLRRCGDNPDVDFTIVEILVQPPWEKKDGLWQLFWRETLRTPLFNTWK